MTITNYEIQPATINESAVIAVRPPLDDDQIELIGIALKQVVESEAIVTYGHIQRGYSDDDRIYSQIRINSTHKPDSYVHIASQAVERALTEQGKTVTLIPSTIKYVGRLGPLFSSPLDVTQRQ